MKMTETSTVSRFRTPHADELNWQMARLPVQLRLASIAVLALAGVAMPAGCSYSRGVDVVVRPQFLSYDRVALWSSLSRETEDLFIPLYMDAFPGQSLVERRDVSAIIGEQDILPERLDEETRAKLRKILGVKAIVYPSATNEAFAVKVIETDTGAITASVYVESGGAKTDAKPLKQLVREAIAALRTEAGHVEAGDIPRPPQPPQQPVAPVRPPPRD